MKVSDHRQQPSSIELELEQLLGLGDSSDDGGDLETEALRDQRRKTRTIQSKRNTRDKNATRSEIRSAREYNDESPKPNRTPRVSRRIKYDVSEDSETAEERDRDSRSQRSKDSKGSRGSRGSRIPRSGHRKSNRSKSTERITNDDNGVVGKGNKDGETRMRKAASSRTLIKRISVRKLKSTPRPDAVDKDAKTKTKSTIPIQRATPQSKANLRKSWTFDDFDNTGWSSSEGEDDVEVGYNDEGKGKGVSDLKNIDDRVLGVNDTDDIDDDDLLAARSGGDRKARPCRYTLKENKSMEQRRKPPRGATMIRSSSVGVLSGPGMKRSCSTGSMKGKKNFICSTMPPQGTSSRRHSRRASGASGIDVDMVLGDPSRKAPPSRSKSNDLFSTSRLQIGGGGGSGDDRKAPPTRTQSNNFAEYLRKQGRAQKSDRPLSRKHHSDHVSIDSKGEDAKDDPFEVTYQSKSTTNNWDPFASEESAEEIMEDDTIERRGKLRPAKSGEFLLTSSRDTISRLRIGANVVAVSSGSAPSSKGSNDSTEREKQRRACYKKSINAAAMAGRRLSGTAPRRTHRQARSRQSSFEERVKLLEGALQRAPNVLSR